MSGSDDPVADDDPELGHLERSPSLAAAESFADIENDAPNRPTDAVDRALTLDVVVWAVPGIVALIIYSLGAAGPSLWADELATWGFTRLSWAELWALIPSTDAALTPYYVFMRGWTRLAGDSDLALRVPSIMAAAATAALIGKLGLHLAGRRAGLLAGLLFCVLPVASRYGQEARPYAFAMMFATAATLSLLSLFSRASPLRLAGYAALVALAGLANPLALTVLVAHGFVVFARDPTLLRRWAIVAGAAVLPSVPLVVAAMTQRVKIDWIATADTRDPLVFATQYFGVAILAPVILVLALLSLSPRTPALVPSAWAVLGTGSLFALDRFVAPVWLPRYLLFALPAWVLLAALTLSRAPLAAALATLLVITICGLPQNVALRRPDGHGLGAREAAAILTGGERPGDVLIYASDEGSQWLPRDVVDRYVPSSGRPSDVLLVKPQRRAGQEFATECADVAACLHSARRVWILRTGVHPGALDALGPHLDSIRTDYIVKQTWYPTELTLALLLRRE